MIQVENMTADEIQVLLILFENAKVLLPPTIYDVMNEEADLSNNLLDPRCLTPADEAYGCFKMNLVRTFGDMARISAPAPAIMQKVMSRSVCEPRIGGMVVQIRELRTSKVIIENLVPWKTLVGLLHLQQIQVAKVLESVTPKEKAASGQKAL